ncbi:MAG: nickel pincer cofactor biosynthesis protein LarC [Planctomycetes bacterium]|nr:nickel pincer cofactor biosynthesis protein LarC [Planctomycetota bacterium]
MPSLLIDMPSGVAGDMLLAALVGCGGDLERMRRDLLVLGLGDIGITATRVSAGGLAAWRVDVDAPQDATWNAVAPAHTARGAPVLSLKPGPPQTSNVGRRTSDALHHPPHRPYRIIRDLLAAAPLATRVRDRAQFAFRLLAEAEAEVHGADPETVEFHEVGAIDAIADVVGCCLLLEQLDIDEVIASPFVPGHGTAMCAHGRMPVPVPAVSAMLARTGAPFIALGRETGELTTPTGCALVCALARRFISLGERPAVGSHTPLRLIASGYGAGHKTIPGLVNVVRCTVYAEHAAGVPLTGHVAEIRCQLDDATGEQLADAIDELMAAGALDAYLTPLVMKKGRPGHLLTVLCPPDDCQRLCELVLSRTPTIGVRYEVIERTILDRRVESVQVEGAPVRLKVVTLPDGRERAKPEADDVAALARQLNLGFDHVRDLALRAWNVRMGR